MNRQRRLLRITVANLAFLLLLWLVETYVAERHWLTTLITYSPQHWAGLPLLVLLPWALIRRSWRAVGLNVLALCVFMFALLGFRVHGLPSRTDGQPVRVMTWNIHHSSRGVDAIVRAVEAGRPDIVCIQEANDGNWKSDVLPELRKAFRGWHCWGFREVATFSRHPIVEKDLHRLMPETGRVVLETVVDVGGQRLTIYNVHLNVAIEGRSLSKSGWRGIPNYLRHTADVRLDQVRDLKEIVSAAKGGAVIAGDFNTPPRGRCYGRIAGRYHDAFRHGGSGFGYTYPSRRPLMRIDYVFTDEIHVRRCFVPNVTGSDHRPVIADLVMPEKEGQNR